MEKALYIQKELKRIFDAPVNLVGGAVRDIILGIEPKDWDFNTPLNVDEIEAKIRQAGRKPYLTGRRFGTIGFKVPYTEHNDYDNNPAYFGPQWHSIEKYEYVEVTQYRTEIYDGNSRKPIVHYTDNLLEDLSRRDFTINAIALLDNGEFYDPFSGRIDIISKKIKPVGDGFDRVREDPLRMLRAARFAAKTNFEVDANFIGTMKKFNNSILRVSKERWVQELDKMLVSQYPEAGIEVLMRTNLLKYILPEAWLAFQDDEIYEEYKFQLKHSQVEKTDPEYRWKQLLYFIGYPYTRTEKRDRVLFPRHEEIRRELTVGICSRLKFSNERTEYLINSKKP